MVILDLIAITPLPWVVSVRLGVVLVFRWVLGAWLHRPPPDYLVSWSVLGAVLM